MEIRVRHFFALLCSVGMVSAMAACAPEETGAITEDGTESAVAGSDVESGAAAQPEAAPVQTEPSNAGYCSGYSGAGSACQVRCSNDSWHTVGYTNTISNGDCTEAGNHYCQSIGLWGIQHCWN